MGLLETMQKKIILAIGLAGAAIFMYVSVFMMMTR